MLFFSGRLHSAQRQARIRPSAVLAATSLLLISAAHEPHGAQAAVEPVRASIAGGKLVPDRSANVTVAVSIDEGWHINSTSPTQKFLVATRLDWQLPAGVTATQVEFPSPTTRRLAFAGDKELELFEGDISVRATLTATADADVSAAALAVLHYQACNDSVCLRPATIELALDWSGEEQAAGLLSGNTESRAIAAGVAAGSAAVVALMLGVFGALRTRGTDIALGMIPAIAMGLVGSPACGRWRWGRRSGWAVRPKRPAEHGISSCWLSGSACRMWYLQRPRGRFRRFRGRVPGYNGPNACSDAFCRQWLFISPAAYFPIKSSVG